jgi:hypothetical protein
LASKPQRHGAAAASGSLARRTLVGAAGLHGHDTRPITAFPHQQFHPFFSVIQERVTPTSQAHTFLIDAQRVFKTRVARLQLVDSGTQTLDHLIEADFVTGVVLPIDGGQRWYGQ